MTIQSLGKTNNVVIPSKSTQNDKVKSSNEQNTLKTTDSVAITAVAKEITKSFESSEIASSINHDRVNTVKKALEDGVYPIDAEKIAEKMIQIEREQYNDS